MEKKKLNNPFVGLINKPDALTTDFSKSNKDKFEEYVIVDSVKKIGEGDEDFVIDKKCKVITSVNRKDYINSFRDDVGILNIMKKVSTTGDISLLKQRNLPNMPVDEAGKQDVIDISDMPVDVQEAVAFVKAAKENYSKLDPTIKNNASFGDIGNSVNNADIQKYIDQVVAQKIAAATAKKEEGEK